MELVNNSYVVLREMVTHRNIWALKLSKIQIVSLSPFITEIETYTRLLSLAPGGITG